MVTCFLQHFGRTFTRSSGFSFILVFGIISSTTAAKISSFNCTKNKPCSSDKDDGNNVILSKDHYDEQEHKSVRNIIIAICVTVGILLLLVLIAAVVCVIFRKKISNTIFAAECEPQNGPGNVFYSPFQFNHRGALQIKKTTPFDPKTHFADEKDNNPQNARFQFTEDQNEVFDIGSEVEQVIE